MAQLNTFARNGIIAALVVGIAAPVALAAGGGDRRGGARGGSFIQDLDTNGDGNLGIEEARAAATARLAEFDTDGDGAISLDEFAVYFAEQTRERMVDQFQRLDDDGDGAVTEAEITAPIDRMAQRFDVDGDGTITREEIRDARGHRRGGGRDRGGDRN